MESVLEQCVGFIQLVFFDKKTGEVVNLGGAGFISSEEDEAAWNDVPIFDGQSLFMADRLNSDRDIIDDKVVSAETCERLAGKPIDVLIEEGRIKLAGQMEASQQARMK